MYRTFLRQTAPERALYVAVPRLIYVNFFGREAIQEVVAEHLLNLLVFDPDTEEVVQWID